MSPDLPSSLRWLMRSGLEAYLRVYHRHEIHLDADLPEPALLVSNLMWTLGVGKIAEALAGRSASHEAAENAFVAGHNVLVFPDGDFDGVPVSASIPWGINFGVAGILPYVGHPTKLKTAVLPAMYPKPAELAEEFAGRVEAAMQERLDKLIAGCKLLVG